MPKDSYRGATPSARSSPKIACSTIQTGASTEAVTRSIASLVQSATPILTFGISQLPIQKKWAMADGFDGGRAVPVKRRLTPGLTSSLHGTARLPPFIFFFDKLP